MVGGLLLRMTASEYVLSQERQGVASDILVLDRYTRKTIQDAYGNDIYWQHDATDNQMPIRRNGIHEVGKL